ncbi:FCD domain-containing protein [Devosia sp. 2618]|uniref:GntR family transcriptional regulator n=1 Tax=Devosia sp. 2618 TaxID=3156454 RepID=UPI003397A550
MASKSHRERIYQMFLARIRAGEIGREDRLIDNAIGAELGVSRMPVRDALMRLTHEGYLVATTRGFMLPALSMRRVREIFEIRRLLEPRAVGQATIAMTTDQIESIAVAVDGARIAIREQDIQALYRTSELVRSGWLGAVPSDELREAISRYLIQVQSVRMGTMRDPAVQRVVVDGQARMLAAFRARDAFAAADEMLRFILAAEQSYVALTDDGDAA